MRPWLGLLLALCGTAAVAATVESVEVSHEQGRYTIAMTVRVAVSAAAAYAVMTDFEALSDVNDKVVSAERLPGDRLHTIVSMCVSFICRDIEQTQIVERIPPTLLRMHVEPEHSDFRFGTAQWRFIQVNERSSLLTFNAELEPDFWIPPVIGPWLVQRKLQHQALVTSNGIERVAGAKGY